MASLFEQYRPAALSGIIGQAAAVRQVERVLARGWGGRAWWITGPSGAGKTTLARIIARHGADELGIEEIDAQDLSLDHLRSMEEAFRFRMLGEKHGKCWVINEAHGMRGPVLSRMLTLLERLPAHVVVIFTTTKAGQDKLFEDFDTPPLLSRCTEIALTNDVSSVTAFARRAHDIAEKEGINGLPMEAYEDCVVACAGNFRRVLQRIESGQLERDYLGQ